MKIDKQNLDLFIAHLTDYATCKSEKVKRDFFDCLVFDNQRLESVVKNEIIIMDGGTFVNDTDGTEIFIEKSNIEEMLELKENGFDCGEEKIEISIDKAQEIFDNPEVIKFLKDKQLI